MHRYRLVYSICFVYGTRANTPCTYRAAVYEHAVITPVTNVSDHNQAVEQMMTYLQEYEKQAQIAAAQVSFSPFFQIFVVEKKSHI